MDATADFILVSVTSTILIWRNLIPLWFLGLISLAFLRFILIRPRPGSDPLGKHIGTVLFISLGSILASPVAVFSSLSIALASSYIVVSMFVSEMKTHKRALSFSSL